MKVDCSWFDTHLEAFFCESLDVEELQLASEHLKTCLTCRYEVQALQDVDPLIKQVLNYRMSVAQAAALAPRRGVGFQLGLAGAALAVAAVLVFTFFTHSAKVPGIEPARQAVNQSSDSPDGKEIKGDSSASPERAKPDAPDLKSAPGKPFPEPVIPEGAPEFLVIDPSGHSWNLQDYRGRVVLIGVWSIDQPEAAQNLQRLYQAFGSRHEAQILGVSSRNQERLAGITFPMVYNDGSRLFDTHSSNYVVVDKEGNVQLRGSLLGNSTSLIAKVKTKLDELGAR